MRSVLAPAAPAGLRPGPRPSFSIVIPAYQASATIGEAVASVRAQTYPAGEIIVCDDGSTDDLSAALAEHGEAVTLIRQEHLGVSAARNALLRAAGCDFVVPSTPMTSTRRPARAPCRTGRGEAGPRHPHHRCRVRRRGPGVGRFHEATPFAVNDQPEAIFERCFVICPAMRRERLIAIGGYDEELRSAEDWDCCIRLIGAGSRAGLVEEPLLEYRLGGASLTASRAETLSERVYMLEKAVSAAAGPASRAVRRTLDHHRARALQRAALDAVDAGDPSARRRLLEVAAARAVAPMVRVGALAAAIAPSRMRGLVEATLSDSTGRPVG